MMMKRWVSWIADATVAADRTLTAATPMYASAAFALGLAVILEWHGSFIDD